jgi:hypothetical protein
MSKPSLRRLAILGAFAALVTGCDMPAQNPTSGGPDILAREPSAKTTGPHPFGSTFLWWVGYDWKTTNSVAENAGATVFFDNNPVDDCLGCRMVANLDANPATKNTIPGIYTYVIANGVRSDRGATDCNVYSYSDTVNGVPVRTPTLCNAAGGWIASHRDTILQRYKRLATRIQASLDARKNSTTPFLYMLEGDYFQYSATSQDVFLSPTRIAILLSDVADTIRKYNPDSRIGFNTSGWYSPEFMAEYFRATRKTNFDFTWISTGFGSDTLDNNQFKSAISTNTWVRRFSGLPILFNGMGSTATPAQFQARVGSGVVAAMIPKTPTATQLSHIAAAKASTISKNMPTFFSDLAPQGLVTSVVRSAPGTVTLAFRAWDRDARIGPTTPGQVRTLEAFINGRRYAVIPTGKKSTDVAFSVSFANLPPALAKSLSLRITDHDRLVTSLPAVNADSIKIDPEIYALGLTTTKDAAGKWRPTNALRFKIPDRGPANQRVRINLYDATTGVQVASLVSDEMTATGATAWSPTWTWAGAVEIPTTVKAGTYRVVMLYNDDNLRTWYQKPFTLRSTRMTFDPHVIYDPWNGVYCRAGFVKSGTTGFCTAN